MVLDEVPEFVYKLARRIAIITNKKVVGFRFVSSYLFPSIFIRTVFNARKTTRQWENPAGFL